MVDETSHAMTATATPAAPPAPPWRELALVLVGLMGVVALQLLFSNGWYLFNRLFWHDEIYTYTLVADPDFRHSMRALADGLDFHPPLPYILLRGWTALLLGSQSEATYRLYSLAWLLVGLLGLYACLRQTYGPRPSAAAVLVVWAHTELLFYAFEARNYAPWFAAAVWFAYCLGRCRFTGATGWNYLALALTAAVLCSLHYLALLSWGLVLLGEGWADRRERRLWCWPVVLATACGPLGLLACLPFLFRQRAAISVPTWISPPFTETLLVLAGSLVPLYFAGLVLGVLTLGWLAGRNGVAPALGERPGLGLWGLTALGSLPILLVTVSFVWQPMHLPRYALPALAAFAPLLAWALQRMPARTAVLLATAATVLGSLALHTRVRESREQDRIVADFIANLRAHTSQSPVAFELSIELLVVCHYAPDLAERCGFLDFDEDGRATRHIGMIFHRDIARRFAAYYGKPKLLSWDELRRQPSFYLSCEIQNWRHVLLEPSRFPGFTPRPIHLGLHEMTAEPTPAPP